MRVAYILDVFPVVSETFIVREVLELQRKGFDVLVFAEHRSRGNVSSDVVHEDARNLLSGVSFFSSIRKDISKTRLLTYHLGFLLSKPVRYAKALRLGLHSRKTFRAFAWSLYYQRKLADARIEHIHAHFALRGCTFAMLISRLTGIPYSFTIHAHDIFLPDLAELPLEKFINAKFVAAISQYNKDYVLGRYPAVNGQKIKIIHCGIDIRNVSQKIRRPHEAFAILSIGRLVEQKGFRYLIEACRILRERINVPFMVSIIGEGKERPKLEEMIHKYKLENMVRLVGAKEQPVVMEALQATDIFVLPCVIEGRGARDGIPVALMEAMAMGIPVISTKVSGIPELIKDGCGMLVEPEDAGGLADAVAKLMALSDEERDRVGEAGKTVIKVEFDLVKEVDKLARCFEESVNNPV